MKATRKEKINTNNAWGFGGGIYTRTHYDHNIWHDKGKSFFRHLPPSQIDRWGISVDGEGEYTWIKGKPKSGKWLVITTWEFHIPIVEAIDPAKDEVTDVVRRHAKTAKQNNDGDKIIDTKIIEL